MKQQKWNTYSYKYINTSIVSGFSARQFDK